MNEMQREGRYCHMYRQRLGGVLCEQTRASRARPVVCLAPKGNKKLVARMRFRLYCFLPGCNKPSRCSESIILKMPHRMMSASKAPQISKERNAAGKTCFSISYVEILHMSRCNFRPTVCHQRHVSVPAETWWIFHSTKTARTDSACRSRLSKSRTEKANLEMNATFSVHREEVLGSLAK